MVKEITLSDAQHLECAAYAADETFHMDEQSFRTFYDRTARLLWSYLCRVSGDSALADDLTQESYYRFLRIRLPEMNQAYMKSYLFRIATNLLRDYWRRGKNQPVVMSTASEGKHQTEVGERTAERMDAQSDVQSVLERLKPREREMLWLAYVEGSSHREIAQIVGLKEQSIRPLLFRARRKMASLLRNRPLSSTEQT